MNKDNYRYGNTLNQINFRKSLAKGEEKGIDQGLIDKVKDATIKSFLYTKLLCNVDIDHRLYNVNIFFT